MNHNKYQKECPLYMGDPGNGNCKCRLTEDMFNEIKEMKGPTWYDAGVLKGIRERCWVEIMPGHDMWCAKRLDLISNNYDNFFDQEVENE